MKLTLEILTYAIKEYRAEGMELMERLGQKYGYDITVKEEFEELIWRGNPKVFNSAALSKKVNYAFHGGACSFHKRKTQQNIEVILSNLPKFGEIDSWFLKAYLDSTKKYQELSKDMDYQELQTMLNTLYKTGEIEEIK